MSEMSISCGEDARREEPKETLGVAPVEAFKELYDRRQQLRQLDLSLQALRKQSPKDFAVRNLMGRTSSEARFLSEEDQKTFHGLAVRAGENELREALEELKVHVQKAASSIAGIVFLGWVRGSDLKAGSIVSEHLHEDGRAPDAVAEDYTVQGMASPTTVTAWGVYYRGSAFLSGLSKAKAEDIAQAMNMASHKKR